MAFSSRCTTLRRASRVLDTIIHLPSGEHKLDVSARRARANTMPLTHEDPCRGASFRALNEERGTTGTMALCGRRVRLFIFEIFLR